MLDIRHLRADPEGTARALAKRGEDLEELNLKVLREQFNLAQDSVRVVTLVSPT